MKKLKIAVDGPAGAGKSTVARGVAARLGYTYLDTGAMYRAIALKAIRNGFAEESDYQNACWQKLIEDTCLEIVTETNGKGTIANRVFLDGIEVTDFIRTPEVSSVVSIVAAIDEVRDHLVPLQRRLAQQGGIVMDGRDIGTVVLPDADCKFFLTATLEERARRRQAELARQGYSRQLPELIEQLRQRDLMDSTRATAPLRKADDAVLIDTTDLQVDEVVELILGEIRKGEANCFTD